MQSGLWQTISISRYPSGSSTVVEPKPMTGREGLSAVAQRFWHFWATSPDDNHNRHRFVFSLVALCVIAIFYELCQGAAGTDLVKLFLDTVKWLVGIYFAGSTAVTISNNLTKAKDQNGTGQ
jgi:hypothetical protein